MPRGRVYGHPVTFRRCEPGYPDNKAFTIYDRKPEARSNGCCSWRQTCCGGGCCNKVGNCCSSGLEAQSREAEKPFNYGNNQPAMTSYSMGMTAPGMPDRVPCTQQERKLPMCFGGDCGMSTECSSKTDSSATMNSGMESMPRESER